ncbi:ubiquitin-like with PHD and RING finger domains 2 [Chamberlinius hualienensis]
MRIQVRLCDGSKCATFEVSRLLKVETCRELVMEEFDVEPQRQRLFYRGKQLEDHSSLFDYGVNSNDTITLMIKVELSSDSKTQNENGENSCAVVGQKYETEELEHSHFFKTDDVIDICDSEGGAWFEGRIVKIGKIKSANESDDVDKDENGEKWLSNNIDECGRVFANSDDGYRYFAKYIGFEECESEPLMVWSFRPLAWEIVPHDKVCVGDRILANYNIEEPKKRGFFYECTVTAISNKRNQQLQRASITKRNVQPTCAVCNDKKSVKCRECACKVCGGKNDPGQQVLCDECNGAYHFTCHKPPLDSLPEEDFWYCSGCKNDDNEIVKAGEKLKASKRKAKMASTNTKSTRDWGRGMACVGRQKHCDVVRADHFGHIPGMKVGTTWKYRMQVSEDGVHRPHVAGIHGSSKSGAYSIVLSGGYEDDEDRGDEFVYTGSGGRDLSGNKRTNKQSCDQVLTKQNLALAMNCNAPVSERGATAKNWKSGKPVRVLRSDKGRKHSKFSPEEGIRYDGIYKIVKYWPEKGQAGFRIWRYLFRRDDETPAPWTKEGNKWMKDNGLNTVKYPVGYVSNNKRGADVDNSGESSKKQKVNFKLDKDVLKMIKEDKPNAKLWEDCLSVVSNGILQFNDKVKENFMCICCQELLCKPVTTPCQHNFCHTCLKRACSLLQDTCPACRSSLASFKLDVNEILRKVLNSLFEGYEEGRD